MKTKDRALAKKETLFGEKMAQTIGVVAGFNTFLTAQYFDIIIELGTENGTLACFFGLYSILKGGKTITIDHKESPRKLILQKLGVEIINTDILESEVVSELLKNLQDKRILLLCDNGHKIKEMEKFAPLLKRNDIIMAHDFFVSKQDWINKKGPWSIQVDIKRIEHIIRNNNLVSIYEQLFHPLFWCCYRKTQ